MAKGRRARRARAAAVRGTSQQGPQQEALPQSTEAPVEDPEESSPESPAVERPASASRASWPRPRLPRTWEGWAYVALIAVALGTRLWDLGGRALHYDEILHAWYSWRFLEGLGYSHTPLTHGPFLFHAGAATYALVGSSDFTARLLPALFGVALVGLPYFLRSELGRAGALCAAGFLLLSPSMLYFGRFMRNDIFMAVWALAMVAVIFRYRDRPRMSLLVAWAALWAFAFATKESAYLLAGTFGLFLLIMAAPAFWEWAQAKRRLSHVGPDGDLFIVLATLSLPLFAPLVGLTQGFFNIVLVNPDGNDPRVQAGELARAAAETGAPAGGAVYIATFVVVACVAVSLAVGRLWGFRKWATLAAVFVAVWLPLFTSVFTNWQGFFTGLWGSLGYWMAQQEVERANQPLHYYALGLSNYEFLVTVPAVLGAVYLLARSKLAFDRFIVGWAALTFALFTIAGERMPWLHVGITLPLAIIAGRAAGILLGTAAKSPRWGAGACVLGAGLGALAFYVAMAIAGYESEALDIPPAVAIAVGAVVGGFLAFGFAARSRARERRFASSASYTYSASSWPSQATLAAAIAVGILALGAVGTGAAAVRASYSHAGFERPDELFVYSQTGQEAPYGAECMERLAEASGLGKEGLRILVGESDNHVWQWRWYLRDYGAVSERRLDLSPLTAESNAAESFEVVMMSQVVEQQSLAGLDGFERVGELTQLWWFPNYAYNELSLSAILSGALSREGWRTALSYFVDREFGSSMQWSSGAIYVRADLAGVAEGCSTLRFAPPDQERAFHPLDSFDSFDPLHPGGAGESGAGGAVAAQPIAASAA